MLQRKYQAFISADNRGRWTNSTHNRCLNAKRLKNQRKEDDKETETKSLSSVTLITTVTYAVTWENRAETSLATLIWSDLWWPGIHYQSAMRNEADNQFLTFPIVASQELLQYRLQIYKSSTRHCISPITSNLSSPKWSSEGEKRKESAVKGCVIRWLNMMYDLLI